MTTPEETTTGDGDPSRDTLAHDLRGRLSTIVSCARVLRAGGVSRDEALDVIERAAREMAAMITTRLIRADARQPEPAAPPTADTSA